MKTLSEKGNHYEVDFAECIKQNVCANSCYISMFKYTPVQERSLRWPVSSSSIVCKHNIIAKDPFVNARVHPVSSCQTFAAQSS